tara:strand:- start:2289 stop:2489 length:201 start_codon:yes stop_codon:yes gene_type:complete
VFFLAAITTGLLTCQQAQSIISNIKPSLENRDEIIQMVIDATEDCGELLPEYKESIKFIDTKPNLC